MEPSPQDHALKRYREECGLSQEAFGERVGRDKATISRWENGERQPDLDDIVKIEAATDGAVTRDDFMPPLPDSAQRTERVIP